MDNKYDVYRQIRYQRTYRTLGKMSLMRVVIGLILLCSVFFISGLVPQMFARRGHFRVAEALMIAPGWMEKYKPETKAFIEAGVLYEQGDYHSAQQAFDEIEGLEAADTMSNVSLVRLAEDAVAAGNFTEAYDYICAVDKLSLSDDYLTEYNECCELLLEHLAADPSLMPGAADKLNSLLEQQ